MFRIEAIVKKVVVGKYIKSRNGEEFRWSVILIENGKNDIAISCIAGSENDIVAHCINEGDTIIIDADRINAHVHNTTGPIYAGMDPLPKVSMSIGSNIFKFVAVKKK